MMKPTMTYEPFSIVIVPFPFTEKLQTKRRPALVLSNTMHQQDTNHITLLMVTSAKHSTWESDYQIKYIESTGLSAPSIIRQKLFTIDTSLILKGIGTLTDYDQNEIKNLLCTHLTITTNNII